MLQISQAPFSDAYLTTQPSKRRRLIAAEKPEGSVERVIAETLQVKGMLRGRVGGRVTREVCEKVAKNVAQRFFWSKLINKLYRGKKWPKYLGYLGNFQTTAQSKQSTNRRKYPHSGHPGWGRFFVHFYGTFGEFLQNPIITIGCPWGIITEPNLFIENLLDANSNPSHRRKSG
jgi:hypothetical protein